MTGEPKSTWRYVQWVLAVGSPRTLRIWSFLTTEGARWVDVAPDETNAAAGSPSDVTVFTAKFFRDNLDREAGEHYTKIRFERTEGSGAAERLAPDVVALPKGAATPEALSEGWRHVEDAITRHVEGRGAWVGALRTPFPKGLFVPYADVVRMIETFQRLGAERIRIEGAPPPKLREDGTWEWDYGRPSVRSSRPR